MKQFTKKFLLLMMSTLLLMTAVSGCAGTSSQNNAGVSENEIENEQSQSITVTDQIGRTVTFSQPVQKIASSYYISTALFVALGLEDKLTGIEMKADTRRLYELAAPRLLELPAIGSGKELNIEQIAAVEPDVVVIPKKLQENVEALEALDIPVLVVNPESQEEFLECIRLLGAVTGRDERAEQLANYCDAKMQEMTELTKDLEHPVVYMGSGSSFLSTATGLMYQNDLIEMAGGTNAGNELTDGFWAEISKEQLAEWNPDYIFAVSYASYTLDDIMNDTSLSEVGAVKNKQVYTFPSQIEAWDYPAPSSILGVMWLTHVLHPDVYSEEAYLEEAQEFYRTYFDIEVSREDLGL